MHPVASAFAPLIGMPSWEVKRGHGSFVTLEFGEPILEIGEPSDTLVFLDGAPPRLPTRSAYVHGQWHLWIYCCDWQLTAKQIELAHSESDDIRMARALRILNGQALVSVDVDHNDGSTVFKFDLGCKMATRPYDDEPHEQWMMKDPSGCWLSVRSDGRYSQTDGTSPVDEQVWHPLALA